MVSAGDIFLTHFYCSATITSDLVYNHIIVYKIRLIFTVLTVLAGCSIMPHSNEMAVVSSQADQQVIPSPVNFPTQHSAESLATTNLATKNSAKATQSNIVPVIVPAGKTVASSVTSATIAAPAMSRITDGISQPPDLWQRIRDSFKMAEEKSPLVARHQNWYASRPEYVTRMTERARLYLYFIVEEVEKRKMPMEIALLPMIESAFNPGAYSGARASGIWQFIPSTGKNFGMQQNWWYDERRDIVSATTGALDYLQQLHDEFGDWELALAAYNCGENSVRRAQDRNRKRHLPIDYASLKLPRETRNYLPKLMAVKNIVSDPASFNLVLQPIANQPYFAPVVTSRHIDVKLAAELAEITLEEFTALNPSNNRPVILQENADVLLLPVDKVEIFKANLEHYNQPLVTWQEYKTKKGERLDQLAANYGMSEAELRTINGLPPHAKLSVGQALLVPLNGESAENEFEAFNTHLIPFDQLLANAVRHTVRKGETLSAIARRYRVRLASLQSWNKGVRILRPGQRIYVVQPVKSSRIKMISRKLTKRVATARYKKQPISNIKRAAYSVR